MFNIFRGNFCFFFLRIFITESIGNYRSETCSDGFDVLLRPCVTIVDIQNENQAPSTIQAKCDLFIGSMQFSNENSCSLTTSLWCVLTLRRVFTVCRLVFIWFGYSLSMNCIHYTPLCRARAYTPTHTLTARTHLRLLTMFVLGQVNSWMKLSRKENNNNRSNGTKHSEEYEGV